MMKPTKCISKEYNAEPFYLIEFNGTAKRFVAWFQDIEKIKKFLFEFIKQAETGIQIRFIDFEDRENPLAYEGDVAKETLVEKIEEYEELIFSDGYYDFMLRLPKTGEYIVFDEHGLIYIYSNRNYESILDKYTLPYKPKEKLVDQLPHWHYRPPEGKDQLIRMINELGLR